MSNYIVRGLHESGKTFQLEVKEVTVHNALMEFTCEACCDLDLQPEGWVNIDIDLVDEL